MKKAIGLIAFICILWGCKEEESIYPPALTEILSVSTDAEGCASLLWPDGSGSYSVENKADFSHLTPDSLYRAIAIYEICDDENRVAHVYSLGSIFSSPPVQGWNEAIKTDPADVQSIWMSGNYLNMVLLVKGQNQEHEYHCIETTDDSRLRFQFYHDRKGDIEAYTKKVYFSIPMKGYKYRYSSFLFSINTRKEGVKTYEFSL